MDHDLSMMYVSFKHFFYGIQTIIRYSDILCMCSYQKHYNLIYRNILNQTFIVHNKHSKPKLSKYGVKSIAEKFCHVQYTE